MIKKLFENKIFRNAGWLIGGKIVQMLLGLLVSVLTARYLGPGNYGLINYANAYITFFSALCTLGINSVIVKELIDHSDCQGTVMGTALGLRGISGILSVIAIVGISAILDAGEPQTRIIVFLCSVGVIFHIFEIFNFWFQSKLKSKKTALAALIAYVITSGYKILLLAFGKSVTWFAMATSVDYFCVAVVLLIFYKREQGERLAFSWTYGKRLLQRSYHFILPSLMVAIYGQTDKIMLKHMLDEKEVGFYATAVAICCMWNFVLSAIIDSLTPSIMEAHEKDYGRFHSLNKLLYCIVFYLSAAVSVAFLVGGKWIIWLLYGEQFLPAAGPLRIITWYTAFSYLGVARDCWIVCENKQKYLKYIYAAAAISNVLLNLIFIPVWGTCGAAVASLAAQVITVLVVPFFIQEMRPNSIMMLEAIFFKGVRNKKS